MGESPRTLLQRGLAYVESWPIAGSCRTASHRHHHLKGSQPAGSCRRTIRQSFFLGSKKGFGSTVRPPAGVRSPSWLDHRASRVRGWFRPEWTSPQADKTFGRSEKFRRSWSSIATGSCASARSRSRPRLAPQGRKLMVVESSERKDDLVRDMIEVLTSFCARLYGRRSASHQAKKAMRAIGQ